MSILGVKLRRDTLNDVKQRLGRAEVKHNGGDAAASASALCYVGAVLVIISVGEMDEGRQVTSDLHLVGNAADAIYSPTSPEYMVPKERRPKCSRLAVLSKITTIGELRLGMTADQVRRQLGPPSQESTSEVAYFAFRDEPYEWRSLKFQLLNGKVIGILAEAAPF